MLTDTPLADAVVATIEADPRIPDTLEIAVAANDGIVTLRGTVERFSQRRAATQDAKLIAGTYDVDNQLKVNLIGADRRDDDEIRGAALQNVVWDVEVPSDFVDVKVHDGWVTLKGDVSYQFESDAAYDECRRPVRRRRRDQRDHGLQPVMWRAGVGGADHSRLPVVCVTGRPRPRARV